jgi:hypothetical protein
MRVTLRGLAVESDWRDEALRTNLWLIPALESTAAVALFAVTLILDKAAFHGTLRLPSWVISGSPDAARQILAVVMTEPISTTNITGMWIITRGSGFLTEATAARRRITGSKRAAALRMRTFGGRAFPGCAEATGAVTGAVTGASLRARPPRCRDCRRPACRYQAVHSRGRPGRCRAQSSG